MALPLISEGKDDQKGMSAKELEKVVYAILLKKARG